MEKLVKLKTLSKYAYDSSMAGRNLAQTIGRRVATSGTTQTFHPIRCLPSSSTHLSFVRRGSSSASSSASSNPNAITLQSLTSSADARSSARALIGRYLSNLEQFQSTFSNFVQVSFSRSGGKGGQNVNKVSTKSTLKLDLRKLKDSIPAYWITNLTQTHFYAPNSDAIVIHSSLTRSQNLNLQDCWQKLYEIFLKCSKTGLIGETDPDQVKRIEHLKAVHKSKLFNQKQIRKSVKQNRSKVVDFS